MNTSSVTTIGEYAGRERRIRRAIDARRRLTGDRRARRRTGGRAWLNGQELGGTDPRHAHLSVSFD